MLTTRTTRTLVIAAMMLGSAAAQAQPRRYTRTPTSIAPPDRGKGSDPKKGAPTAPPLPDGPTVGPDDILTAQGKAMPLRDEQIRLLDQNIADCAENGGCTDDEIADYHYRKAELFSLAQRYYKLETQRLAIAADGTKVKAKKAELARESAAAAKQAQDALLGAVTAYKALVDDDDFQNYANTARAMFFYGYMLGAGGYAKEMRDVFERLLREHPNSPYVPEAHVAFADYHFENKQLADAEDRYRRVLKFPKSSVFWYATYKLGWVQLNQRDFEGALGTFHDVIEGVKKDAGRQALFRAAKNDLVRAYAEVGNVQRGHKYFQKIDEKAALAMYELLGDLLRDTGKSEKAVYVYRELIGLAPKNASVCVWQHHVADAMLTAGTNADKIDEIEKLAKLYGALKKGGSLATADLDECHDLAKEMTGDLARAWHSEWAKTKDPATYALADRAYAAFTGAFAGDPDLADTQYFAAELRWSRADAEVKNQRLMSQLWDDTATAFIAVVDAPGLDKARRDEAARAAVLAAVNSALTDPRAVADAPPPSLKTPSSIAQPQPIPERDQKVLAAFALYEKKITDTTKPERIEMGFYHAALLRRYAHHAEALPLLVDFVAHHRDHPLAEDAVNALLDSHNQLGQEAELVGASRELLADTAFLADKESLKKRLAAIEVTYLRKQAEKLEGEGRKSGDREKLVACGKAYAELYNRDTEADGADELLFNSAVCFEDGKSVGLALGMYQKLEAMGDAAREDIRARAVGRLGVAYARVAWYSQASKYLELYYQKYAGVRGKAGLRDAKDALSDAVMYRKGTGDDDLAIKDTLLYVANKDAKAGDKAEAFFNLYAVYEKQGDTDKLVEHLRKYIATRGAAGGTDRLVQAHARLGMALWTASCPGKTVDGSCIKVTRTKTLDAKRGGKRIIQTQCGSGSRIELVERDAREVKQAMDAFADAVRVYEKADKHDATATLWYAQARLYQLEPRYEAYLGQAFPANLDFDPERASAAKKSMARFEGWLATKEKTAKELKLAYQAVIAVGEPTNAIAAAARVGQIAQNASEALTTAEIPAAIRPYAEARELYCDTLADKTEGLDALTIDAYAVCLETSTTMGWFSEWSRLCERELGQLQPGRYPATSERRAAPVLAGTIIDVEPRVARLDDE
jgi:TolA-binding protein